MSQLNLFQETLYRFRVAIPGGSVTCACKCAAKRFTGTVTVESYTRPDWYDTPQCGCMNHFVDVNKMVETFNTTE